MKKTLLAGAFALAMTVSGCLGPFNTYNGLRNWNAELSDQDWVNEIVFLAIYIIPVYGIASLADAIVFNAIDYWGGENPIGDPGPFPESWGVGGSETEGE